MNNQNRWETGLLKGLLDDTDASWRLKALLADEKTDPAEMRALLLDLLDYCTARDFNFNVMKASNEELNHACEELSSLNSTMQMANLRLSRELKQAKQELTDAFPNCCLLYQVIVMSGVGFIVVDRQFTILRRSDNLSEILFSMGPYETGTSASTLAADIQCIELLKHIEDAFKASKQVRLSATMPNSDNVVISVAPFKSENNDVDSAIVSFHISRK